MKKVAAFFDFDNTLLNGTSVKLGFYYLRRTGRVSLGYLVKLWGYYQLYSRQMVSPEKMAAYLLSYYQSRNYAEYKSESPRFYETEIKPHLSPVVLKKLEEHRQKGHMLVILSASPSYYLEEVQKDLKIDHLISTVLEIDDQGLFTGRSVEPACIGDAKEVYAKRLAEKENIDLSLSYAYGDEYADLAMLNMVGHPCAVQPEKKLLIEAQKNKWPILYHANKEN